MNVLIIYAHPYAKSFNHQILVNIVNILKIKKISFSLIDLYQDNFNPVYNTEELSLFKYGKTTDYNVKKYQSLIKNSDEIIFIFPIWWNDTPAIIKGFIDKVMKKRFAYEVGKTGVIGNLTNIKKVLVITTSTSPTLYLKFFCGNAIKSVFINSTLSQLGMKKIKWLNCGRVDKCSYKKRNHFLYKVIYKIRRTFL